MLHEKELEILVSLNSVRGVGITVFSRLLKVFKNIDNIPNGSISEFSKIKGIGKKLAVEIKKALDSDFAIKEIELSKKMGVKILTYFDLSFPFPFKYIFDRPILIYCKGELINEDFNGLSIIGARNCSFYGKKVASKFAQLLASNKITVISGLARGIDTIAHTATLKGAGRTIGILGSGLSNIYPKENKSLAEKISKSGCIISEMPLHSPPDPRNFPRRNRLISALGKGVLVIEASARSGALITVDWALEQGKEIFSIPGSLFNQNSIGTNNLIKNGAKPVTSFSDIIDELYPEKSISPDIKNMVNTKREYTLNEVELKIIKGLSSTAMHIDEIAEYLELDISRITSNIISLEMKGLVKFLPGNYITLI